MFYKTINTKCRTLYLTANDEYLLSIQVEEPVLMKKVKDHKILDDTYKQLEEYFKGERKSFDLPLYLEGTELQKQVYQALSNLDYGETLSYEGLSILANRPKASRAVASVCARNRYLIVVPCHRIISKNGGLGGYSAGLEMKRYLIELEHVL